MSYKTESLRVLQGIQAELMALNDKFDAGIEFFEKADDTMKEPETYDKIAEESLQKNVRVSHDRGLHIEQASNGNYWIYPPGEHDDGYSVEFVLREDGEIGGVHVADSDGYTLFLAGGPWADDTLLLRPND